MSHRTPRSLWIRAIVRDANLADMEARRNSGHSEGDDGGFICHGFDSIFCAILRKINSNIVCVEAGFIIAEFDVAELIGTP